MSDYKIRKRYRLTFANENTFNDVWTLKLSPLKVWLLSCICVAAIAALVVVTVVFTPVSWLLPGYLKPSQRAENIDNTVLLDSLLDRAESTRLYIENLRAIMDGDVTTDSLPAAPAEITDTLLAASGNEREFVRSWAEREKNSLSVLTPVVAEGMLFRLPATGAMALDDGSGFRLPAGATVGAINEGTVVGVILDAATGRHVVTVQYANDFISITGGIAELMVSPGQRVTGARALGRADASGLLPLTIWHRGRPVRLDAVLPVTPAE